MKSIKNKMVESFEPVYTGDCLTNRIVYLVRVMQGILS